jgi:hypothetical protein
MVPTEIDWTQPIQLVYSPAAGAWYLIWASRGPGGQRYGLRWLPVRADEPSPSPFTLP